MRKTVVHILLIALVASLATAGTAAARPVGIDVSNHQGKIRWSVVPDRIEFAFLKASESTTFIDSWYDRNRKLAKRNGKVVGAYHFARPDGRGRKSARRDARREARFFNRIASPRKGELRPVLDLEVNDAGLTPRLMIIWTKAFLQKLRRLVGVKGMIYTSPYFWQTAMNDTKWFANHGYKALWIAHWDVKRPSVPAGNWAGKGWTFWQFTDCGTVKGISGCVDKNRYNGTSFRPVRIR